MKPAQESTREQRSYQYDPVSAKVVRRYAVGSIGTGGFGTLPGLVLVYYLTDSLGVTALLAGAVVTTAKLWDVIIDPIIGELSDISVRRTGSRKRFMMIGACALPIMFVLTFAVPANLTGPLAALWVFVCFLGAATAFSFFQVPYISLPAELTDQYDERTRLLTWRVVILTIAILAFGGGGPALRELAGDNVRLGYLLMAVVAALAFALAFAVSATIAPHNNTREPESGAPNSQPKPRVNVAALFRKAVADTKKLLRHNVAFRTLLFAFFAQALATGLMLASAQYVAKWVLHDQAAVTYLFVALIAPALIMSPVWGKIAAKVGKERAFMWASAIFIFGTIALVGLLWVPGNWLYIPVALCGSTYAGMQSLPMAMLPDVVAYSHKQDQAVGESRTQPPTELVGAETVPSSGTQPESSLMREQGAGVFGGVWTAGETTGLALGSTIMTVLLALAGYVESVDGQTVSQPDVAISAIVLSFSLVPALCIAASLPAIRKYPLTKKDFE